MKKTILPLAGIIIVIILAIFICFYSQSPKMETADTKDKQDLMIRPLSAEEVAALKQGTENQESGMESELLYSKEDSLFQEASEETWKRATVEMGAETSTVYLVLEYTNGSYIPHASLAYNPDFSLCISPFYIEAGLILFRIEEPLLLPGEWTVRVLTDQSMGTYNLYVLTEEEYQTLQEPNIDIPRDLGCEGAQIDD